MAEQQTRQAGRTGSGIARPHRKRAGKAVQVADAGLTPCTMHAACFTAARCRVKLGAETSCHTGNLARRSQAGAPGAPAACRAPRPGACGPAHPAKKSTSKQKQVSAAAEGWNGRGAPPPGACSWLVMRTACNVYCESQSWINNQLNTPACLLLVRCCARGARRTGGSQRPPATTPRPPHPAAALTWY